MSPASPALAGRVFAAEPRGKPHYLSLRALLGFPGGASGKEPIFTTDSVPGKERSPGGGYDNPFQYSCLENPMERAAWWATAHGFTRISHDWSDLAHTHVCELGTLNACVIFTSSHLVCLGQKWGACVLGKNAHWDTHKLAQHCKPTILQFFIWIIHTCTH